MPADLAQINNFLLTSDYPLDKVVYLHTEAVSLGAFGFANTNIAHGLSFIPLINATWSTSSDFSTTYSINAGPPLGATRQYNTAISADATNVSISTANNTASAVTLYFRIYGFMPSNVDADVIPTATGGDNFTLNTDYNYTKLIDSGIITGPGSGYDTETVAHNLGYRPQVALWKEISSSISPHTVTYIGTPSNTIFAEVSTTELKVYFENVSSVIKVHYRIYGDTA